MTSMRSDCHSAHTHTPIAHYVQNFPANENSRRTHHIHDRVSNQSANSVCQQLFDMEDDSQSRYLWIDIKKKERKKQTFSLHRWIAVISHLLHQNGTDCSETFNRWKLFDIVQELSGELTQDSTEFCCGKSIIANWIDWKLKVMTK